LKGEDNESSMLDDENSSFDDENLALDENSSFDHENSALDDEYPVLDNKLFKQIKEFIELEATNASEELWTSFWNDSIKLKDIKNLKMKLYPMIISYKKVCIISK
jgi:hypothetical protein